MAERKSITKIVEGEEYTILRLTLGEQLDTEERTTELDEKGNILKWKGNEFFVWQLHYGIRKNGKQFTIDEIKEMDKVVANILFRELQKFNRVPLEESEDSSKPIKDN